MTCINGEHSIILTAKKYKIKFYTFFSLVFYINHNLLNIKIKDI